MADRVGRGGRVGSVSLDQYLGPFTAYQCAAEPGRDGNHKRHFAAGQQVGAGAGVVCVQYKAVIAGGFQRLDQGAGQRGVLFDQQRSGQLPGVGIDGVAEQDQLHNRNTEHHREGQTIAAHLHQLLHEHGPYPAARDQQTPHACHRVSAPALAISAMKASSRLGRTSRHWTSSPPSLSMACRSTSRSGPLTCSAEPK